MNANTDTVFHFSQTVIEGLNRAEGQHYEALAQACIEAARAGLTRDGFRDALKEAATVTASVAVISKGLQLAKQGMLVAPLCSALMREAEAKRAADRKRAAEKAAKLEKVDKQEAETADTARVTLALNPEKVAEEAKPVALEDLLNGISGLSDAALVAYKSSLVTALKAVRAEQHRRASDAVTVKAIEALQASIVPLDAADAEKAMKEAREARRAAKEAKKAEKAAVAA